MQGFYVSGWQDSNLRSPRPKRGAIPGYATPRSLNRIANIGGILILQ